MLGRNERDVYTLMILSQVAASAIEPLVDEIESTINDPKVLLQILERITGNHTFENINKHVLSQVDIEEKQLEDLKTAIETLCTRRRSGFRFKREGGKTTYNIGRQHVDFVLAMKVQSARDKILDSFVQELDSDSTLAKTIMEIKSQIKRLENENSRKAPKLKSSLERALINAMEQKENNDEPSVKTLLEGQVADLPSIESVLADRRHKKTDSLKGFFSEKGMPKSYDKVMKVAYPDDEFELTSMKDKPSQPS